MSTNEYSANSRDELDDTHLTESHEDATRRIRAMISASDPGHAPSMLDDLDRLAILVFNLDGSMVVYGPCACGFIGVRLASKNHLARHALHNLDHGLPVTQRADNAFQEWILLKLAQQTQRDEDEARGLLA